MTEVVALGAACVATARYETPTNSVMQITDRISSVCAALRDCGRRNALTPFAIASTPVSADDPDAKAFRITKTVSRPVPAATGCGTTACGHVPSAHLTSPAPIAP